MIGKVRSSISVVKKSVNKKKPVIVPAETAMDRIKRLRGNQI